MEIFEPYALPLIEVTKLTPGKAKICRICQFRRELIKIDEFGNQYWNHDICQLVNGKTTDKPADNLLVARVVRYDFYNIQDRLANRWSSSNTATVCTHREVDEKAVDALERIYRSS